MPRASRLTGVSRLPQKPTRTNSAPLLRWQRTRVVVCAPASLPAKRPHTAAPAATAHSARDLLILATCRHRNGSSALRVALPPTPGQWLATNTGPDSFRIVACRGRMERFLAAVVQMASGQDRNLNLERAATLVRAAARRGASLVVLPEVFAWRGPRPEEHAHAETVPGPAVDAMAAVARETGVHLLMGSILERAAQGEQRTFNTSCLLSPAGELVARYRKIHLFDVDIPGRVTVRESDARAPGSEVVTVRTELGTL